MRETLYLRLRDPSPAALTSYALIAQGPGPESGVGVFVREAALAEILAQAHAHRVIAFVPDADVRLTQVRVPARQPAKVLQAAPFVLEDQFAEDVETLHFALGARQPDGAFPIAAVAREQMDAWMSPFREAGISLDALVPETLALPWAEGAWSVLAEPRQLIVRSGVCAGFSCLPEEFESYLLLAKGGTAAGDGAAVPTLRILQSLGSGEDFTRLQRPVELLAGYHDPLEVLLRHLRLPQSINLLQGDYSQREQLNLLWRPWRLAAIAAGVAFALGLLVNGVQAVRLEHAANAQDSANAERFRELFPNENSNVNLVSLVEQKEQIMRSAGAQGGLLYLIQQAAQALAATPGLKLKTLQFREGALYLDLGGNDLQVLEQLRNWFAAHGGARLDVQSADAGDEGVQIRLKLSAT